MQGKLIVIDGLDGSGKTTQIDLILDYYKKQNKNVKLISFPDYDSPSSSLVKMYLAGEFGTNAVDVNAYAASSFYAVDRYASFKKVWESDINSGTIILCARYTTANAIHQMSKMDKSQWDTYLDWLYDFEFVKLGLPKPDKVIFLDMPIEVSQKLMTERYNGDESKKDIHEKDLEYLKTCRETALYAAEKLNWVVIPCANEERPRTINEISNDIIKDLDGIL